MRTAKNHGINIRTSHRFQIILDYFLCYLMLFKSFFHQRNKQRAGLLNDRDLRVHSLDHFRIHPALNRCLCPNYSDFPVLRRLYGCSRTRNNHSQDWDIKLIFHRIQCQCTCSIAGDHDRLHLFGLQKTNDLFRKTNDRILRLTSIRNAGSISEINNILIR